MTSHGVSVLRHYLLNSLFQLVANETSAPHPWSLCKGNPPVTSRCTSQGPVTPKVFPCHGDILNRIMLKHLCVWLNMLLCVIICYHCTNRTRALQIPMILDAFPWASCQICKIMGCACAGNAGNVFPAIPTSISARAWRACRDACQDR